MHGLVLRALHVSSFFFFFFFFFFFSIKILALVAKDTQYSCTKANFACMPKG